MLTECASKHFENGSVYLLRTKDGFPIEVSDLGFAQFVNILHYQASKVETVVGHIDKWWRCLWTVEHCRSR